MTEPTKIVRTNRGVSEERELDLDDSIDALFLEHNTVDPAKVTRVVKSKADDSQVWRTPTNPIFVIKV